MVPGMMPTHASQVCYAGKDQVYRFAFCEPDGIERQWQYPKLGTSAM